uniref:SGNH domain-containing protein n=2 Tax=Bursaphelenchus xylophilus TaxID=6326 RepID=A0A1I7S1A6_BURXY
MERFVKVGDISYAIYLIHWPFLELFKFGDFGKNGGNEIGIQDGVFLITSVLIVAYLLENFFKTLSSYVTSWSLLVTTLLLLYSTAYYATMFIESKSWEKSLTNHSQSNTTEISFEDRVIKLYENRGNTNLTTKEAIDFNMEMKDYVQKNFSTCHNQSQVMPTDVKLDWKYYSYWCHKRGNGKKEVLLLGNSLSRDLYFGVQHYFSDVFDHLTFLSASGCIPFASEYISGGCRSYVKQIIPVVKKWHRPVDIVILQQSYLKLWPHNYTKNDAIQRDIQRFYDELSPLVKDVIFMSSADFFEYHPFQKMQKSILNNEDLSQYQIKYGYGRSLYGDTQRRIDAIKCEKCRKIDYSEQYCDKIKDSCTIIHENKILQHHDGRHSTMYGSLLLAEKLKEEYDHWENSRTEL